jgi:hypothetical protein
VPVISFGIASKRIRKDVVSYPLGLQESKKDMKRCCVILGIAREQKKGYEKDAVSELTDLQECDDKLIDRDYAP